MAFGGKQSHCYMSCDHELANEWAHCGGKNASYITIITIIIIIVIIIIIFIIIIHKKFYFQYFKWDCAKAIYNLVYPVLK